jgi:hypothetical protein
MNTLKSFFYNPAHGLRILPTSLLIGLTPLYLLPLYLISGITDSGKGYDVGEALILGGYFTLLAFVFWPGVALSIFGTIRLLFRIRAEKSARLMLVIGLSMVFFVISSIIAWGIRLYFF